MVQLAVWLFLHFLKAEPRFALTGCLVKGPLGTEDLLCGNGRPCLIQLIRRLVGTVNIFLQSRIGAFLVGELQTGGRTAPCRRTFPGRLIVGLRLFPCGMCLMAFRRTHRQIDRCARLFLR